jgi:dipeptidyl aminopeptidase/acylaminoacyl peptidase
MKTTLLCGIVACITILALADSPPTELEREVTMMAKIGSCSSPSFSPDGRSIAFVSDLSGVPQVWIVPAEGGFPRAVTALDDQVGSVSWSPTGDLLAFMLAPGGGMNVQVYLVRPDGTGMRRITAGGTTNNWFTGWTHDGGRLTISSNQRNPAAMDSFLAAVNGGEMALAAKNPGIGRIADVGRDGRFATVYRMASRGDDNLYLIDLESGRERLLTPHEPPATFGGGEFSPDGRTIYLASNADRDLTAFARIRLGEGGAPGQIEVIAERGDAELSAGVLSDDGARAALLWSVAGRAELDLIDLATLELTHGPALPAEIAGSLEFSPDGDRLVMTVAGAAAPSDIWMLDIATAELRQITRSPHAGITLDRLVRPKLVQFDAHDGLELSGWLYLPPGHEGPGPMVLSFHGGPEGQERPMFRSDYQALLAQGIAVFAPNVRGSSGFGKKFVNLDNGALRFDGVKDIESCVRYVVDAGHADPKRIGIAGGSYGGYMTMAGLAEYPELFAAGANLFGVVNFETFFAHTEPWMAAISTVEYGDPKTQQDLLRSLSPIHKIDQVVAPTIVLHGANDTNVPVVEAEQVVDELKRRGVPVEYVLFPDEGHGFSKTENRIRSEVAVAQWFVRYLKP